MSATKTIKLYVEDGLQALRLPMELALPGDEVWASRSGDGVLLRPIPHELPVGRLGGQPTMPTNADLDDRDTSPTIEEMRAGLARLEKYKHIPFMENGREQPAMPDDDDLPPFDP